MNRILTFLLAAVVALCPSGLFASERDARPFVVVIDPGHGGKDYGAIGKVTNEKTINLDVALRIKKMLKDYSGIEVVLTRSTDTFLSLQQRADIANAAQGNLFVSVHVNSVDRRSKNRLTVKGASVYTLGLHRSNANFEVAKRENSVMELEPDFSTTYQGFDPNSTESYIIFELSQNKHLTQSINFAQMAQGELVKTAGRADRGVLQAGFWVLLASAMPAALVELDFICNPTSEQFLHSVKGKEKMARALTDAIVKYAEAHPGTMPVSKNMVVDDASDSADGEDAEPDDASVATEQEAKAAKGVVTYRVQIMACDRRLPDNSPEFKGLKNVDSYRQGGFYKYTVGGDFASEEAAERYARKSVRGKFPKAFIIKWRDGQRID